tara:strand:+ start:224 stop:409 length:186 start_codon:yes stop_codon:yes gene_type:complete
MNPRRRRHLKLQAKLKEEKLQEKPPAPKVKKRRPRKAQQALQGRHLESSAENKASNPAAEE